MGMEVIRLKPDYLYKYVSLESENDYAKCPEGNEALNEKKFSTLLNKEVWFSHPKVLNDPFEFQALVIEYDKLEKAGIPKDQIAEIRSMMLDHYLISSFFGSEMETESFPMWAHYANNHKGFCIRYRVMDDECIRKVNYFSRRTVVTDGVQKMVEIFDKLKGPALEAEKKKLIAGLRHIYMQVLFLNYTVKHSSWSYEKEYRVIHEPTDTRDLFGQNVPAQDVGLLADAVYLGFRCEYDERIREICSLLDIPCLKCRLDDKKFMVFAD